MKSHSVVGSALHAIDPKGSLFNAITWSRDGSHTKSVWSEGPKQTHGISST